MLKIAFMGAGSTVFAKNLLGDLLCKKNFPDLHIALYDIDKKRLEESRLLLTKLTKALKKDKTRITTHCGVSTRKQALRDARYVINAIQVGGYDSTMIDFEIPKKYGLRQTIGDTLGIGGIFRALRTIPVLDDFANDMAAVCPEALFLNYVNPMAILTGWMLRQTPIKTVGLCHSVQVCVPHLFHYLGIQQKFKQLHWKIAGINHMAWLLEIKDGQTDLYPLIKQKAAELVAKERQKGNSQHHDLVRLEMMRHFGYYITESSEHNAEYTPYWIKRYYPHLIQEFNIPLDEYPRRCRVQMADWERQYKELLQNKKMAFEKTIEYAADIIEAIEFDKPFKFNGNILNNGLIPNLPAEAVVEVPCLTDGSGIHGCYVGPLPTQCAALNMTNINVQLMTIVAAQTRRKEHVYQAAMLDPHTAAELSLDDIVKLCDDLFEAHGNMLPKYK